MAEALVDYLVRDLKSLQSDRMNFDVMWEKIARVVLPTAVGFTTSYSPGTATNKDIFDATGQLALPRFAAAIDTLITPQTSKWHNMQPKAKFLRQSADVQRFLSYMNDRLFAVRYSPRANFASRNFESYVSMGAFGNGVLYVHDAKPGIQYISIHLSEIWFAEDHSGRIDKAYWVHEYTQRQMVEKFPDAVMKDVREDADKNPNKKIKVCKAVFPRTERDPRNKDKRNMKFASITFRIGGAIASNSASGGSVQIGTDQAVPEILEESGYRTFPFAVARYVTGPREIYARGPAYDCYPDMMTLQEMAKTTLRFGQLSADPFYMATDADALDPFSARPGAINFGYLSPDGTERIKPMRPSGDPGFSLELANQRRESVNGAFLINLFQALIDRGSDRMTATEVMQLVQEKGALIAPVGGRLRTEYLSTIIDRETDILFNAGVIRQEDIPEELLREPELDIEYDSPLTRALKAEEGVGILRSYEFALQLAQVDPQAVKSKLNVGRALERIAEVNGAPPDVFYSEEEAQATRQREEAGNAAAAAVEAAPNIAQSAMMFAKAQSLAQGQPAGNA